MSRTNFDDQHFSNWLDREIRSLASAEPIATPSVVTVEEAPRSLFGLPKAIAAASAMLVLALGGGAVLAGRTVGTANSCSTAAATSSETIENSCATPAASPSATATPTPTATATPSATPSASPSAAANHGALVSAAAHSCPKGAGGIHGKCVSAVARGTASAGSPSPSGTS